MMSTLFCQFLLWCFCYDVDVILPNFVVVLLLNDVDGLFEPDAVDSNTALDVQGDVEVVLCNLLYVIL